MPPLRIKSSFESFLSLNPNIIEQLRDQFTNPITGRREDFLEIEANRNKFLTITYPNNLPQFSIEGAYHDDHMELERRFTKVGDESFISWIYPIRSPFYSLSFGINDDHIYVYLYSGSKGRNFPELGELYVIYKNCEEEQNYKLIGTYHDVECTNPLQQKESIFSFIDKRNSQLLTASKRIKPSNYILRNKIEGIRDLLFNGHIVFLGQDVVVPGIFLSICNPLS